MTATATRPAPLRCVLLVDDDPDWRALTREAFQRAHPRCRVREARNGAEALRSLGVGNARAPSTEPDLVCLDVEMPGVDGWEVLRAIRAERRLDRLPVVILTGRPDAGTRRRARGAGAAEVAAKSDDLDAVVFRITAAADAAAPAPHALDDPCGSARHEETP